MLSDLTRNTIEYYESHDMRKAINNSGQAWVGICNLGDPDRVIDSQIPRSPNILLLLSVLPCNDDDDKEGKHVRAHRDVPSDEDTPRPLHTSFNPYPNCLRTRQACLPSLRYLHTASRPIHTTSDLIISAMSAGTSYTSVIFSAPQKRTRTDASTEPGASRRSSRRRDSGLYDPNKPVLLHENIIDGAIATPEVLTDFEFALCDADTDTWL